MHPTGNDNNIDNEPLLEPAQAQQKLVWCGLNAKQAGYVVLTIFLISSVGEAVINKKITYFASYPAALSVMVPLAGIVLYPGIVFMSYRTGTIQLASLKVHPGYPIIIAAMFSVHHMLLNVGAANPDIPGAAIGVLVKFVVPCSMVFNWYYFNFKYILNHYVAVVLLLGGVCMVMFSFPHISTSGSVLIVLSTVPLAWSFYYVEKVVVKEKVFAVWLWFCVCMFQALISVALKGPTVWLQHHTGVSTQSHTSEEHRGEAVPNLKSQIMCYAVGRNPAEAGDEVDCSTAASLWYLGLIFGLGMNLAMPLATKYAGASMMWLVKALAVPISGFLFAQSFVMGEHAVTLSKSELVGLVSVSLAIFTFNWKAPADTRNPIMRAGSYYEKEQAAPR